MRRLCDREYFLWLLEHCDSKKLTEDDRRKVLESIRHGWIGSTIAGARGGSIYLTYHNEFDWWMIHAVRDDRMLCKLGAKEDWSFHAMTLVLNYFFTTFGKRVYTAVEPWRKRTVKMLERLEFRNVGSVAEKEISFSLFSKAVE